MKQSKSTVRVMRAFTICLLAILVVGCSGGKKHETAEQEDVRVGGELLDKLLAEAKVLPRSDSKRADALARLQSIQENFMGAGVATKAAAAERRKLLEGKTVADLARDHREHPFTPSKRNR